MEANLSHSQQAATVRFGRKTEDRHPPLVTIHKLPRISIGNSSLEYLTSDRLYSHPTDFIPHHQHLACKTRIPASHHKQL